MGLCIVSLGVYPGLSGEEESGGRMAEVVPLFSLCFLVGHGFPCVCVFVFAVAGEPARSFSARAMPTALAIPCPSGPVVVSTPGVMPCSG